MEVLIVDDEVEVAEMTEFLVRDYFPSDTLITIAQCGNAAIKILKDRPDIDLCICDHHMPNGLGSDVLKHIIAEKLKTKFVLCSTIAPSDRPLEYSGVGIFFNILKPDVGSGIENLFNLYNLLEKKIPDKKLLALEYSPISVHLLALMEKTPVDIYIRMSDNKFIKCINQSETFSAADKEKFLGKMIQELFVKKGHQQALVNDAIMTTTQKILERRNMPLADKMSAAHAQLMGAIKNTGMTPELAAASKKMIQHSVELIMKSPMINDFWVGMNLMGEFPSKLYTLHSMLACGVLKKLNMDSEKIMFKLILSAYLQDITLDSIPLMEICDYKEFLAKKDRFSEAEIKKFHDHPIKAAEIVSHFKEMPPDILRIILEQHEMPDGSGFPRKLKANQLEPVTCVFIVTGIFARHVLLEGEGFEMKSFVSHLEEAGYSAGNFKEAVAAIKAMQNSIVY